MAVPVTFDRLSIERLSRPPDVVVRVPGSKSLTNRALLCAALAKGESLLSNVLFADDTYAMLDAVSALGAQIQADEPAGTVKVGGTDVRATGQIKIDARQSGTTSRFVLPVLALSAFRSVLDGSSQLQARPFAALIESLRQLGAEVDELGRPGHLPVAVRGPARGGQLLLPGHLTSQFLSGLLIAGPLMPHGLHVQLDTPQVSAPYLHMTGAVMAQFGVSATIDADSVGVQPGVYRHADYVIEPDATAASYFLAAAAITGGRVTITGLGSRSVQGDVAFVDALKRMGASTERTPESITVRGPQRLQGIDINMADISDTAQTLAAVAVFADTPTRVRGIGFIRAKETDRINAIVTELQRCGIRACEDTDGFTVWPGRPTPVLFETYDDHRMAMSLALIGLRADGVQIHHPDCVTKTYPRFFDDLAQLRAPDQRAHP